MLLNFTILRQLPSRADTIVYGLKKERAILLFIWKVMAKNPLLPCYKRILARK